MSTAAARKDLPGLRSSRSLSWRFLARAAALGLLAVAFIWRVTLAGIPRDREQVLAWLVAAVLVATVGDGSRRARRALLDWLPFAVLLLAYDYTRGAADSLGMPIQTQLPIVLDQAMFAGEVPTVWLQERLGPFDGTRWWEVGISVIYFSHFVLPYVVAAAFWLVSRRRFLGYLARFLTLTAAGLATYVLLPTRPPWMASQMGVIGPVDRMAGVGWRSMGAQFAESVLSKGQAAVNQVAALPSLHTAFSMLVACALWPVTPRWLRPLVVAYPIAMGFTLVISGEHYVFDVLLGYLYVAVIWWAWARWDARRSVAQAGR